MISIHLFNAAFHAVSIFILSMIGFSMFLDKNKPSEHEKYFVMVCVTGILMCCTRLLTMYLDPRLRSLVMPYIFESLFILLQHSECLFFSMVIISSLTEAKKKRRLYGILQLFAAVCLCAFSVYCEFTGKMYSAEGERTWCWFVRMLYPLAAYIVDAVMVVIFRATDKTKLVLAAGSFLPAVGIYGAGYYPEYTFIETTVMLSAVVIYIYIYMDRNRTAYRQELELSDSRMETMMSQIQPHFLYNTISTAAALCRVDPEKAAETMSNFGKYLRVNLDSLKIRKPIPFTDEIKHIKAYVNLEKARFGDRITVEYHLGPTDFLVPSLSVQPIVENSIKHGITESSCSGTVTITTWDDEKFFYVEIKDDGCGFDAVKQSSDDSVHIGITNVKNRLSAMVNGDLLMMSIPGKGTKTVITLPKKKNEEIQNSEGSIT